MAEKVDREEVGVGRRKMRRRNVVLSFRRSCSAASALLQTPGAGYPVGFLSGCREEPETRERAGVRAHCRRRKQLQTLWRSTGVKETGK